MRISIFDYIYKKIYNKYLINKFNKKLEDLKLDKIVNSFDEDTNLSFEEMNILTQPFIYDRIIHKDNTCDTCNKYFGKDNSNINIFIDPDNSNITIIECKNCMNRMYFINWDKKEFTENELRSN